MSEAAGSLPRRAGRRRLVPSATFGRFVARRAIALVFLAIGITLVVFLLTQLVPSDPVTANLGEQAAGDPAAVAAFKEHYGLDKPLPERYLIYLGHVVRGDLGESALTHNPVTTDSASSSLRPPSSPSSRSRSRSSSAFRSASLRR